MIIIPMKLFKNIRVLAITLLMFLVMCNACFAKDIRFEASVDRNKVSLGSALQLNLTFYGVENMSAPGLPNIDGFKWQYTGSSTSMSIVNGKVSNSITYIYMLLPVKAGTFQLGPFSLEYQGAVYTSKSITVEVVEGQVPQAPQAQAPVQSGNQQLDLKDRIFLTMQVGKNTAYLNESVPLTIKLYVNKLAVRDIQYPQFNHEGISAASLQQPRQYQEVLGALAYDVIEFDTTFFGIRPGEFKIGPAILKCNLMAIKEGSRRPSGIDSFFDDFFGGYEAYPLDVNSTEAQVKILPLPEEGKPQDFSGAMGNFALDVSVQPHEVRVGDPVTLKMAISGEGNFNTINCPKLESIESFKVYDPQIKQEDGTKVFEQVIMPMSEKIQEIPRVIFSFFDISSGTYRRATAGPFPITVTKEEAQIQKVVEPYSKRLTIYSPPETLGKDIIYIKDSIGNLKYRQKSLYKNKVFVLFQLLPLALLLILYIVRNRLNRLKQDVSYARRLNAPKKVKKSIENARSFLKQAKPEEFYNAVFKAIQEYLGDKFDLASGGITIDIIDEFLKTKNIEPQILEKLRNIFKDCDMARYAAGALDKLKMETTLKDLEEIIFYFQRMKE